MSSSNSSSSSIFLEAAKVSWGRENCDGVTPVAGLSGGESFLVASPNVAYQVWFSVNAVGVAPTPANGETLIEVALPTAYTVADATALIKSSIETDAEGELLCNDLSTSVNIESIYVGAPLAVAVDVDSGFGFEALIAGFGGDLGYTKEGIELAFEASTFDIKANQTGELLLDQVIQSTGSSLSMSILETTQERIELILGNGYGDSYLPAGGTKLVGFGTSKQFSSSFDSAGKLVIHPIRLADADKSRDWVFWKTVPLPESINFDGTDSQALAISFTALLDSSKAAEVSVAAYGDWTQDVRA